MGKLIYMREHIITWKNLEFPTLSKGKVTTGNYTPISLFVCFRKHSTTHTDEKKY